MTETGRYDVSGLVEVQHQPGSRGRVLRNLLGIISKRQMDEIEAREQKRALEEILSLYTLDHRFKAADIYKMLVFPLNLFRLYSNAKGTCGSGVHAFDGRGRKHRSGQPGITYRGILQIGIRLDQG